ncbi:Zn-ribbon domain-containing OB-fold protein [Mycobacterium sp. NPDC003323]
MSDSNLPLRADVISLEPPGLRGLICGACAERSFPVRQLCPHCGSESVEQILLSQSGTVVSWTVVHQAPPPLETPYTLVTVDLDGVRLLGAATTEVNIGATVTVDLFPLKSAPSGEALWWYRFRSEKEKR